MATCVHNPVVATGIRKLKDEPSRFDELVDSEVIRPPLEVGDPTENWPDILLPAGTATELIDDDRGEA